MGDAALAGGRVIIKDGRQVSPTLAGIRDDHVARYDFAARALRRAFGGNVDDLVLDLGCGCGYGSSILAQRSGLGVISVDIDQGALDYGAAHYDHPRIVWQRLDAARDLLPRTSAAVAFEVVEHVRDATWLLVGMPGRVLVGSVPNQLVVPFDAAKHHRHFRHYTPAELRDALEGAGWRVTFLGGQTGKHGAEARVVAMPDGCRTLVFEARRTPL